MEPSENRLLHAQASQPIACRLKKRPIRDGVTSHLLQFSKALYTLLTNKHPYVTEVQILDHATSKLIKQVFSMIAESGDKGTDNKLASSSNLHIPGHI